MKHVEMQREELEAQILKHRQETAPNTATNAVGATTPSYTRCIK